MYGGGVCASDANPKEWTDDDERVAAIGGELSAGSLGTGAEL